MHSAQPKSLGYQSQLYCVHDPAVLLHHRKKTETIYLKIFEELKKNLVGDILQRVVLDSEKAAIRAARKTFSNAAVEDDSYEDRKAKESWNGGRQWKVIKDRLLVSGMSLQYYKCGISPHFLPLMRALRSPPVPSGQGAYRKCKEFLNYFHTTWTEGPFKGMWCK
ncbi:hypothetical protein COOONC_00377 [Cooperia oncophora]